MARFSLCAALLVATVGFALVGCQPAKELPDALPKGNESAEASGVPAASTPAAKEYVEKAVKSFTGGKPELLAKCKSSRTVMKGQQHKPNVPPVDVNRTIAAVWPDRLTDTDVMQSQDKKSSMTLTGYLNRPRFIMLQEGQVVALPNPVEVERNFTADETAQYWMQFLLPLTDPKAIVFDLQSVTSPAPGTNAPRAVQTLKLSIRDFPIYQVTFDAKTDLLLGVEYTQTELGVARRKQWTVLEHKAGPDGLMLPQKVKFFQDGSPAEEFEVEKWEFPASIPDSEFDPSKK